MSTDLDPGWFKNGSTTWWLQGQRRLRQHERWLGNPERMIKPFEPTTQAPWIRGRVFKRSGTWYMRVVIPHDTDLVGQVYERTLVSDNTNDYYVMQRECREAVEVARRIWARGIRL